jgi:hypothetical protein
LQDRKINIISIHQKQIISSSNKESDSIYGSYKTKLTKEVKDLYNDNCEYLWKWKGHKKYRNKSHMHGEEESILL